MSDQRKLFFELNNEYQECLNHFYDKFLEGKDVNLDNNICNDILNKMKATGSFYEDMNKEFKEFQKNKEKEEKNK